MQKQTILYKEEYTSSNPTAPISLKQYIFIKNNQGKKRLLLRLSNQLNEKCTAYGFWILLYDSRNVFLGKKRFDVKEASCIPGLFVYKEEIPVDERCTKLEFFPIYATFGNYTYTFEDNETTVQYTRPYNQPVTDYETSTERLVQSSSPHLWWAYVLVALLVIISAIVLTAFLWNRFFNEHSFFIYRGNDLHNQIFANRIGNFGITIQAKNEVPLLSDIIIK